MFSVACLGSPGFVVNVERSRAARQSVARQSVARQSVAQSNMSKTKMANACLVPPGEKGEATRVVLTFSFCFVSSPMQK